jgi:hypothetical protein
MSVDVEAPVTALKEKSAVKAAQAEVEAKIDFVVIDVRFHPNGLVNTANHRPEHIAPQDWFDLLCRQAPSTYRPLAGGRGSFRIDRDLFDRIWQDNTK